jgi:hypothetical protein
MLLIRKKIKAGHFLVFNYNGHHTLTITVFDETMCRRNYCCRPSNAIISSSFDDERPQATICFRFIACICRVCNFLAMIYFFLYKRGSGSRRTPRFSIELRQV